MDDDDDFELDNTGDLELDHEEGFGEKTPAQARTTGDNLISGDEEDSFGLGSDDHTLHQPPAGSARPSAHTVVHHRGSASDGLFGESVDANNDDLELSGDEDFDIDHDTGVSELPPRPPPRSIPGARPPAPGPSRKRGSGSGLFSDSGNGDNDDLDLSGGDDFGGDIDIGHTLPQAGRPLPPPAANFTDPSVSLDANDSDIADLLGPQTGSAAGAPAPLPLPPRPPPPQTISAPPPLDPSAGYGLAGEDSELAELLGEGPPPPPPRQPSPAPLPPAPPPPARRISFQEPVARSATHRDASPAGRPSSQDDDFGSVEDDGDGYGLHEEVDREVARIAGGSRRRGSGDFRGLAPGSSARDDSLEEDLASGDGYEVADRRGDQQRPAAGPAFRRIPSQGSGYGASESPVQRDRNRGSSRGRVGGSSDAYDNYDDDEYDEYQEDSVYDSRGRGGGGGDGGKFRRVPAAEPLDDDYDDDEYDDEDEFADDVSWDGEIRRSQMSQQTVSRSVSAGHARSRGPHPIGSRRRAQSAMPSRERQALMLEDMQRRHPSTWDIREVAAWLDFIGMGQYRSKFVHHSVDGTLLLSLREPELARDLRILPLGHRRALLGAIDALKARANELEKEGVIGAKVARTEAERVAELQRRAADARIGRRPSTAGRHVILPEPGLGPAHGKITVYEQRAKLLYQLDRARQRAAQHAAVIDQLANNKALTEAQVAELRGKLKDLETKHKDELMPAFSPGMAAPVTDGGGGASDGDGDGDPEGEGGGHRRKGAAARAAAMYGEDAAVPWFPVGRGTRTAKAYPERYVPTGRDADVEFTFQPRTTRVNEVPAGQVRDIVAKALGSRTPFWQRMDFEFRKMAQEREQREEARRKRRERMGVVKRGGEGEDEEQAKSKYWNNYWVPGSGKDRSYHKHFKRGSENVELQQYRSFARDKERLSRWFKRFVDDGENTAGDVALERLVNRMIRALVKTKNQLDQEIGESFDTRIRRYFEEHGYKFATHTSNTIKVRARGSRPPAPKPPSNIMYDFEEVEQFYPDYLRKKVAGAGDFGGGDDEEDETPMVPKRTTWKWLVSMYYMDRQKKLKAAIAMVKMAQFVQRHGAKWPPERDRDKDNKDAWVPSSPAGALHQLNGLDHTFNEVGRENISRQIKLKKALGPPEPMTHQRKMMLEEQREAKAEAMFALMGWPHSSGDPSLGPPQEPLLGVGPDGGLEGGEGGAGRAPRRRWAPPLDFFQALDALLSRAIELRRMYDTWTEDIYRCKARGYGFEGLPEYPPPVEDMDWSGDPLLLMQERAMEREREKWLLDWEKERRRRERLEAKMRLQGYLEEDIVKRLGRQRDPSEVDDSVQNHLFNNVVLLSRLKPKELLSFRDKLQGTKKKMTVYRALCSQMFLEETREKEQQREETLRTIYEAYRRDKHRVITPEEEEAFSERVQKDLEERQQRQDELKARLLEEESSSMTPWYLLPREVRQLPVAKPTSRATSPTGTPRTRARSRSRSPGARSASRTRSPSNSSKYVFGSSTPKSMWGPMGPVRQPLNTGQGRSLLDSPSALLLQGGHSTTSLGVSPSRTPRDGTGRPVSASRPERGVGSQGGQDPANRERELSRGRGRGAATPTRQRPTTPSRTSSGDAGGGGRGTPTPAVTPSQPSAGPTQRPQSTRASTPTLTPAPRASGGGAAGAAAPPRRTATVPQSAPGPGPRSPTPGTPRTRPASPGGARYPPGPSMSPRRTTAGAAFTTPPSPARSSGGAVGGRGRSNGGGAGGPSRRGLMDGDTSGTSASPSPERRPPSRGAPIAAGRPGRVGPNAAPSATAARRGGLGDDSDSSPSPQRRVPQPPPAPRPSTPPTAVAARAGAGPLPSGPQSRRSSQSSGVGGTAGRAAAQLASRTSSANGQRTEVEAHPPPARQPSNLSEVARTPSRLSPQGSAASAVGQGPSGRTAATTVGVAPRASGTGSATGSVGGGGSAASQRASFTTAAVPLEPQASITSRSSSTSVSGRGGGNAGGGGSGNGSDGTGRSSFGTVATPHHRSPLSRTPVDASPQAVSPQTRSPPASPPPRTAQGAVHEDPDGGDTGADQGGEVHAGETEFSEDGLDMDSLTQGGASQGSLDLGEDALVDGAVIDMGDEEES